MDFGDLADAAGGVMDAVGDGVGMVLGPVLGVVVDVTFDFMCPLAAELSQQHMCEKFPALNAAAGVFDACQRAAIDAAYAFKSEIQAWIDAINEDAMGCFHAVGTLLMRALRAAVTAACKACLQLIGGCLMLVCPCLSDFIYDCVDVIEDCVSIAVDQVKEFMKTALADKGLPRAILDMLDFAFSEYDDIGSPPGGHQEQAPQPMMMGSTGDQNYEEQQPQFEEQPEEPQEEPEEPEE